MPRARNPPTAIEALPAGFKASLDDWEALDNSGKALVVYSEQEFFEKFLRANLETTYLHLAESTERTLRNIGLNQSPTNTFRALLPDIVIMMIVAFTNPALHEKGHPTTNHHEYRRFIHHMHLVHAFDMSLDLAWEVIMPSLARQHGFMLMELARFKELLYCSRAFGTEGRNPKKERSTWMRRGRFLRKINDLEVAIFKPSVEMLLNLKDGSIVVDDELIGSRAGDVELKTLSARKAGKDGPVADCVGCGMTAMVLGMRLRVKGEAQEDNVTKLLSTLPEITSAEQSLRVHFDRGYGKMQLVLFIASRLYDISTIASKTGSRHPFILYAEYEAQEKRWDSSVSRRTNSTNSSKKITPAQVADAKQLMKPWVLDGKDLSGSNARVAKKTLTFNGTKTTVYATAIRDCYDKKVPVKDIRFFSSGPTVEKRSNVWVAVNKKMPLPSNTLFVNTERENRVSPGDGDDESVSDAEDDEVEHDEPEDEDVPDVLDVSSDDEDDTDETSQKEKQEAVEKELLKTCKPLTVAQRTADWFLMKSFRITGTMAKTVAGLVEPVSNETAQKLLDSAIASWFGRHRGTEAMQTGSLNEAPTALKFASYDWVLEFYEVGLLEWNESNYVGVSPDGIARIIVNPGDRGSVLASVEIKTRVAANTIGDAMDARHKHGGHVSCTFGDDVFCDCVPHGNRSQILHQAVVTGLDFVVFVVAKMENDEGSIVQTVIICVPQDVKETHAEALRTVGAKYFGWMTDTMSVRNGYLEDVDCPLWVTEEQRETLISRFPLWCAQYKVITASASRTGTSRKYIPSKPVATYKHAEQVVYNKGKWGLDKNTEVCVGLVPSRGKVSFEQKYLFRMIAAVLFNHWRVEQAYTKVRPYIAGHGSPSNPISANRIRRKARELPFRDHVIKFSLQMLKELQMEPFRSVPQVALHAGRGANGPVAAPTPEQLLQAEQKRQCLEFIERRKILNNRGWPVKRDRAKVFHSTPLLNQLRCLPTPVFDHSCEEIEQTLRGKTKSPRQYCALCQVRKAPNQCKTCKVALCTSMTDNSPVCFEVWHRTGDLLTSSQQARERESALQERKKAARYNSGPL